MEISREVDPLERELHTDQKTGQVRDGLGNIIGRQKWLMNVDFSLDSENQEYIVNAATEAEEVAIVDEVLVGETERRQMGLGAWLVNVAAPVSKL